MLVEKLLLPYILFSFLAITVCQPQDDIEAIGNRTAGDWIPACLKSTNMKVTSMAGAGIWIYIKDYISRGVNLLLWQ